MREFELIRQYFAEQNVARKDVELGIGDDCAVVRLAENKSLVVTTDTLVSGVHFPTDTDPKAIGHKAIAVNLSDLAAMGAEPCWVSLALTLPEVDEAWLKEFSAGLFELCEFYNVQLIGGDTTQGPLSISVTAHGVVPNGTQLTRSGARPGDWVYVTGNVGDAGLALQAIFGEASLPQDTFDKVKKRLDYPSPRVLVGQSIREHATSAIDISDGLLAELGHLANNSNVGFNINLEQVPVSNELMNSLPTEQAYCLALTAGDDYELLFTASDEKKVALETAMTHSGVKFACIGQVNGSNNIELNLEGKPFDIETEKSGFKHFS